MEDWVSIKNLRTKNPDLGTRKIAELLGVSRNTVKKALASEDAPKYRSTAPAINEHVLPFEGFIKESFLTKKLKASRILKDIISKGYKGSQYALYAYIRNELKPLQGEISHNNPNAYKSYETAPGEQMQYDWADYTVSIGGELTKIYIHQTILGYSRYKSYSVTLSVTQSDVLNALEESFKSSLVILLDFSIFALSFCSAFSLLYLSFFALCDEYVKMSLCLSVRVCFSLFTSLYCNSFSISMVWIIPSSKNGNFIIFF